MFENNENNDLNKDPNSFGLPRGYFQNSANSITNKIEWIEEHKIYSNLSSLKKESGFVIPEKYFSETENKLELIDYPTLLAINKINGFKTPVNYFEELATIHQFNLLSDNENESYGFEKLNAVSKQNNFKVDGNYFANVEEKITVALLAEKKEAKVVKLFSEKIWYAAAAVLTITLGLWVYSEYFKVAEIKDCGTLACVDKFDLVKAKNLESLDNDQLYELVDTKKLEEKLENKTKEKTEIKKDTSNKKDTDTSLKNVSTEDLLDEI
ncbi:MAG: hypothetical protein ABIP51_08400 [Bacteroidia bacterium]